MKKTKQINVGGVLIGGGAPVSVQSMTNTKTEDVAGTVTQIKKLKEAGCQIVRIAVPNERAADAIGKIKEACGLPIVADIHFNYRLAVKAAESGADKIRINPGNIGGRDNVKAVVDACKKRGLPIRIGINSGSLEKRVMEKYGRATPEAMLESAMEHVRILNSFDFDDICLSLKSSDVKSTVEANIFARERVPYPLHIGVTEAGAGEGAIIKSSVGIGALLLRGIGDTVRVSLTGDPVREVKAAIGILKAAGLRKDGVEIISCPTCGRTNFNLVALLEEVTEKLKDCKRDIKVAVMGCEVNGPGEAAAADYGIGGGAKYGILFKKGEKVARVPAEHMAEALCKLIDEDGCK
ncbi:MAG: flavodoxin-dependent (E)-4-hydroxy-3-methylbut-2-enyl-diphosphate synthase [Clostridiales bacterium]|jgi:(E)-4-hydroxy-3-methylbut-2-enyl-diphosphate synthase|nr:flavodoxin-dependent (E)-4-hydroxy-3-methylbut-2-enyl-diphosphate synthase [Clostridiales bacterium]